VPDAIAIDDADGVRTVTWNRPDALNAMSLELWDGTRDALRSAAADGVGCVVLTGTGRGFTVGQDLAEMTDPRHGDPERGFRGVMAALADLDVPLLAAVNGLAVGFGTTLLPWCDLVVAASSARFRVPFVGLGVTTEAASSVTLPAAMGPQAAARFVLTGDWLSADDALAAGLVGQVVPDDELAATAGDLARRIAAQPPNALRATTRLLHAGRAEAWAAAIERENAAFAELAGGPGNLAAIERFFSKGA
jgi:enoyl-CoA hydratase/carnithine racemase